MALVAFSATVVAVGQASYRELMFVSPTPEAIATLVARNIEGPVAMLNLVRFREVADYSDYPDLAPDEPISGNRHMRSTPTARSLSLPKSVVRCSLLERLARS